ncbi:MAG: 2-dehydro-3-deoxygluconokinase [Alphaproteobacteria bacterium]|jgi:2-dehydro-3-deoxygluconokinase
MPNFRGSIPKDTATGKNIGVKINTAGVMSINAPTTNNIRLMVLNEESGERSFLYWRNESAAKLMMTSLSEEQMQASFDVVFFSGITLAILNSDQRDLFFEHIKRLKAAGSLIIFDPNYRPTLWDGKDSAKQTLQIAFEMSDWLMPGVDDFAKLYGLRDVESCLTFCKQFDFRKLVLSMAKKRFMLLLIKVPKLFQLSQAIT